MKTNFDNSGAITPINQKRRGAALILVLSFLVLITALVIAFFTSVTTELSGAKQYAGGATAKQLADSAVQTVMGTIKLATSGTTNSGLTTAWASQPGMIRTYDSSGDPVAYYKLYSSDTMVLTGSTSVTPAQFDPSMDCDNDWNTKPALFTDLNSPIVSGTNAIFPIIDGNAIKTLKKTVSGTTVTTATTDYYGYNANGDDLPDVEGFSISKSATNVVTYDENKSLSSSNTPVPMPVRWIYILRSGSLTVPTGVDASGNIANWAGSSTSPSTDDPITGRIAFWTDDDTCKVNINTASEGTYWDFPRTQGAPDKSFAVRQPVNKEFQRYPGHPATTSLSPVFPTMWLNQNATQINENIYNISPRVSGSGSMGGSLLTTGPSVTGTAVVKPDNDRLYASIDELMFKPLVSGSARSTQGLTKTQLEQSRFFITANNRAPDVNLFNKPRVCIWPIATGTGAAYRTSFDNTFAFCSTNGRNPSTGNGNIFYFQRDNRDSTTADLEQTAAGNAITGPGRNRMLLEYLRDLTNQQIPGFGGDFASKYNQLNKSKKGTDRDQILMEIFDYIRCANLNDKNLALAAGTNAKPFAPAFPSKDAWDKWDPMGSGQVVPIQDNTTDTRGFGRFPTISRAFFMFIGNAQNPPFGSGTFAAFDGTPMTSPSSTWVTPTLGEMFPYATTGTQTGVLKGRIRVQAGFFLEPFCAASGHIDIWPKYKIKVSGLDKIVWGPVNTGTFNADFPKGDGTTTSGTLIITQKYSGIPSPVSFTNPPHYPTPQWNIAKINLMSGGNLGFMSLVLGSGLSPSGYKCVSTTTTTTETSPDGKVTVTTSDLEAPGINVATGKEVVPAFYFSGGNITVTIRNAMDTEDVQTLNLNFPPQNFPAPQLAPTNPTEGKVSFTTYDKLGNFRYFVTGSSTILTYKSAADEAIRKGQPGSGGRLSSGGDGVGIFDPCAWIIDTDTVRSIEVASGDARLVAAQAAVTSGTVYAPHKQYTNLQNRMAHSLRGVWNNPYYGASVGRLINLPIYGATLSATDYRTSCSRVQGNKWRYTNNTPVSDFGNPSTSGTGIFVGGSKDPRQIPGDWDNGSGPLPDGPYINKADEGDGKIGGATPYYVVYSSEQIDSQATLFSPNRQIPSAAIFGSLPTGVFAESPWQTLLFRPLPIDHPGLGKSAGKTSDLGAPYATPPDHLLLDLFNMPVVEPYPISEPLSTAGRINMNYQIAPFTYINRDTGIRAVLKSEQVIAIADSQSTTYKSPNANCGQVRYPINMDETLKGFTQRFTTPSNGLRSDIFRSASEICSIHLVPNDTDKNAKYATMADYWWKTGPYSPGSQGHRPTGDNSRERPYATIYPRLTTKSNTYTVHFRVQTLKKTKGTAATAATWDEQKDTVVGEYRGSQTIERYVDASDPLIPDYADTLKYSASNPAPAIDQFYKFRILGTKNFTP